MPTAVKDIVLEFRGKKYLHVKKACEALGITRPTADKMISEGVLGFIKIGGKVYVPEEDIASLFKVQYRKGRGPARKKGAE